MPLENAVKDGVDAASPKHREDALALEGKKASDANGDRPEISRIMEENRKLKAELEKRGEEFEDYKADLEERLNALQSKSNPTSGQEREIEDIEAELRALDANPKAKVWDERIKRKSESTYDKREARLDYQMAVEWIEDVADGLNSDDAYADPKKMERAIVAKLKDGRWGDRPLRVRVKKAWKEIQSERSKSEKDDAERKREIERREEGGRSPMDRKASDFVGLAKEGKIGDALDRIYESQTQEQRKFDRR